MLVGIDSALKKNEYCIKTKENKVITTGIVLNEMESFNRFIDRLKQIEKKYGKAIIGIESTNTYHLNLTNRLQKHFKVIIIDSAKTARYNQIYNDKIKNDSIDAEGIVDFLRNGLHKEIMPFNQKYPLLKELCRTWTNLQQDKTRIAARIHTRLEIVNPEFKKYFFKPFSTSGIYILKNFRTPEELATADLEDLQNELDKIAGNFAKKDKAKEIIELAKNSFGTKENIEGYVRYIQSHLHMYQEYNTEIKKLKRQIRKECEKDYCKHEIDLMTSIKGVSKEYAAGILSELGDVNNFPKRSSVWRFAGLATTSKESGQMSGKKKLTKKGSKYLRFYLYNITMKAKLHTKTFFAWHMNKMMKVRDLDTKQKKGYKAKYTGALTRRMLDTLFLCLKYNRKFDDDIAFGNLELEEEVREFVRMQNKEK